MNEAELRRLLSNEWAVVPHQVSRLAGGMNSEAWDVRDGSSRWAAKAVTTRDRSSSEAGPRAAQRVEAGGLPAGAPRFGSVDPDAAHLDVEPWVRPVVRNAVREREKVRGDVRTWGLLHGDPGYRWAVQADYFARRIAENDLTGIKDPNQNHNGLDDARRHLEAT